MGWESRDWAKWTDEERDRYLGGTTRVAVAVAGDCPPESKRSHVVLLAAALSALATFVAWHVQLGPRPAPTRVPAMAPLVYGTGLAHLTGSTQEMTCTAMTKAADGTQSCTTWTYLLPGQRAVQAAPLASGASCAAVTADQRTGRWVCGS